jgi:addiction module HigA family antidote
LCSDRISSGRTLALTLRLWRVPGRKYALILRIIGRFGECSRGIPRASRSDADGLRQEIGVDARSSELIKGKRGITADGALDLAEALGTSPKVWMDLRATRDLAQAERRRRNVA